MKDKGNMKIEEMSKTELEKFIEDKVAKATKLRFDISSKQIKNHREYRNIKKDIARAITVVRSKQE